MDDDLMEQLNIGLRYCPVLGLSRKSRIKDRGFDIGPLRSLIEEVVDEKFRKRDGLPIASDRESQRGRNMMSQAGKTVSKYYGLMADNNVPIDVLMGKGTRISWSSAFRCTASLMTSHLYPGDLGGLIVAILMLNGCFTVWKEKGLYWMPRKLFARLLAETPELLADIWPELSKTELCSPDGILPQIFFQSRAALYKGSYI